LLSEVDSATAFITNPATASAGSITIAGTEGHTVSQATPATGTISIIGAEQSNTVCTNRCTTMYDTGSLSVTVSGLTVTADYGKGSTSITIATALATALNVSGSPVQAVHTAGKVTMTSIATGLAANYPFSVSNGDDFSGTDSAATMTGGGAGTTTYDSGTVSVTMAATTFTAPWGSTSTAQSVASQLASMIQSAESGIVTVTASGSTIHMASVGAGTSTNWPLSCSASDTASQSASFTANCSGLSGGANASTGPATLYSYTIPSSGGYAANGNLQNVTDLVMGSWTYGYDHLNRLTQAVVNSGTYMGMNVGGASLGWSYDSFGNRLTQSSNSGFFPSGSVQYAGANNRATGTGVASAPNASVDTLQYDAAGNLVGKDGFTQYAYDAEGRVCAVTNGTGPMDEPRPL